MTKQQRANVLVPAALVVILVVARYVDLVLAGGLAGILFITILALGI